MLVSVRISQLEHPCVVFVCFFSLALCVRERGKATSICIYSTVSVCSCLRRCATEPNAGAENRPAAGAEGGRVPEHALTCHIIFVTFEGRAPLVSGALTLQPGSAVLVWPRLCDCGAADH